MVIFAQNGGVRSLGQAHLMRLGVTPTLVGSADNTLVKLKLQYKNRVVTFGTCWQLGAEPAALSWLAGKVFVSTLVLHIAKIK